MSDPGEPSEFGGKVGQNGFQPTPPHVPEAFEKLRAIYTTGDDSLTKPLDTEHAAFTGLLPEEEQRRIVREKGLFEKGQEDVFLATE